MRRKRSPAGRMWPSTWPGRAPLMMAASNELVDEMNAAIRDDLRHLGLRPVRRPRG